MEGKAGGGRINKTTWILVVLVIAFVIRLMFFVVDETEQAVVLQFGKPVRIIREPGLHMKLPEPVQVVKKLDDRVIVSESTQSEILTSDKKNLVIDYFVVWRITDPLTFIQTVGNEEGANYRISDIIYSEMRRQLGLNELLDIISVKRDEINSLVTEESNSKVSGLGISVVDVRIRRINFPEQNKYHVYERMRSERLTIAKMYRSEGDEEATKIRAETDKLRSVLLSSAYYNASVIRGEGDAEAARIYGSVYELDPEFYRFTRSLEAYKKTLPAGGNTLILSSDSELFKYLTGEN